MSGGRSATTPTPPQVGTLEIKLLSVRNRQCRVSVHVSHTEGLISLHNEIMRLKMVPIASLLGTQY